MLLHSDITLDAVMEAVKRHRSLLDNPGFCTKCGAEAEGLEPDAEGGECEICGAPAVYGAEALLFMLDA